MKPEHVQFPTGWYFDPDDSENHIRDPGGHPWLMCEDPEGRACLVAFDPVTRTARQRFVGPNGETLKEWVLTGVTLNSITHEPDVMVEEDCIKFEPFQVQFETVETHEGVGNRYLQKWREEVLADAKAGRR